MKSWALPAALLLAIAGAASADEVELTTGEIITDCKVVEDGEEVRISRGAFTRIVHKSEIRSIRRCDTQDDEYLKRARELAEKDLDGQLKLARWCVSRKLADRAAETFRRVLLIDPDHEEARAGLGHRRHLGEWMTEDQVKEAQGLVRHKGRWMTPEQRDLELALEAQKELDSKCAAEAKKWVDRLDAPGEAAAKEAKEKLAAIEDRYKVKPYLNELRSSKEAVRKFIVEELGRLKDEIRKAGTAVEVEAGKGLARRALWDTSEPVRRLALDALLALEHEPSWSYLTPGLSDDSSTLRRRTEEALARVANPKAAPALIGLLEGIGESLAFIEQYEKQVAQILQNAILLKNGQRIPLPQALKLASNGIDAETKKRLAEERGEVLRALSASTGQDFGADVAKWKTWWTTHKK